MQQVNLKNTTEWKKMKAAEYHMQYTILSRL